MLTYSGIVALLHGKYVVGCLDQGPVERLGSIPPALVGPGFQKGRKCNLDFGGGRKLPHEFGVATGIRDDS